MGKTHFAVLTVWIVCVIVAISGCAHNKNTVRDLAGIDEHPRLAAYLSSPERLEGLYSVGKYWDKRLGVAQDCTEDVLIEPMSLILATPITLPENREHPTRGSWIHRYKYQRCDHKAVYNAFFFARTDGAPPEVKPYFPGTTNASWELTRDAMTAARMAAALNSGKLRCGEFLPIDMEFKQHLPDGRWTEIWTMEGCGSVVKVYANFTPKRDGGTSFQFN